MVISEVLIGFALGYLTVSICESFFHRYIQHAPKGFRRIQKSLGMLGKSLHSAWYSHHVIHHCKTFRRSHSLQFQDREEKTSLDKFLAAREMIDVAETGYGTRIGERPIDVLKYVAPTLPIFVLICSLGGPYFTLGAFVPFIAWPLLAEFIHPYLHMKQDIISKHAPLHARFASRTTYFRWLAIHHWMHHRYERCNYNLLLGGDVILGVQRYPNPSDWKEMRDAGLWTPGWSRTCPTN